MDFVIFTGRVHLDELKARAAAGVRAGRGLRRAGAADGDARAALAVHGCADLRLYGARDRVGAAADDALGLGLSLGVDGYVADRRPVRVARTGRFLCASGAARESVPLPNPARGPAREPSRGGFVGTLFNAAASNAGVGRGGERMRGGLDRHGLRRVAAALALAHLLAGPGPAAAPGPRCQRGDGRSGVPRRRGDAPERDARHRPAAAPIPDRRALDAVPRSDPRRRPRAQRSGAPARAHDVQGYPHPWHARLGGGAAAARECRGHRRPARRRASARGRPGANRNPCGPAGAAEGQARPTSSRTRSTRSTPRTAHRTSTPAPASTSRPTPSACRPTGCRCGRGSSPSACANPRDARVLLRARSGARGAPPDLRERSRAQADGTVLRVGFHRPPLPAADHRLGPATCASCGLRLPSASSGPGTPPTTPCSPPSGRRPAGSHAGARGLRRDPCAALPPETATTEPAQGGSGVSRWRARRGRS